VCRKHAKEKGNDAYKIVVVQVCGFVYQLYIGKKQEERNGSRAVYEAECNTNSGYK
jgi:hypothetical protein